MDGASEHLYAQDNISKPRVDEYDTAATKVGEFGEQEGMAQGTLATNAASGDVYVAPVLTGKVFVFGPDIVEPNVTIRQSTEAEETEVTANGEVSPDAVDDGGEVVSCVFEYVSQTHFEKEQFANAAKTGCSQAPPYSSATSVSARLTGLLARTSYHVRLAATDSAYPAAVGYSEAPNEEIVSTKGLPTISGEAASMITRNGATLKAKIDPDGYSTAYWLEYGETDAYGTKFPVTPTAIGEEQSVISVTPEVLTELRVGTSYHFRFVARNSRGTEYGSDATFTTIPVAGVAYQYATAGPHTAAIKVAVNPTMGLAALKDDTTCVVQYVAEMYKKVHGYVGAPHAPCISEETMAHDAPGVLGAASGAQNVIVKLAGLATDTTYDYQVVVANETGEEVGLESSFATFGIESGGVVVDMFEEGGANGATYRQAGGHPYEFTTQISFQTAPGVHAYPESSGRVKDIRVELPIGLIGNPQATAKCTVGQALNDQCPAGAQVGLLELTLGQDEEAAKLVREPLYNVVPERGVAAEFATNHDGFLATVKTKVRTGEGYGIEAASINIPTIGAVNGVGVTMWGVPADASHDTERSLLCIRADGTRSCPAGEVPRPFVTAPTRCAGGELTATVVADSYQAPGEYAQAEDGVMPAMTKCEDVPFSPSIAVASELQSSDSPTALKVGVTVPQNENPSGIAEADLENAEVRLPAGVTVNPSSANGLVGCPMLVGNEVHEGELGIDLENGERANCPDAAKVGSVRIKTPLLEEELEGGIYVAQQNANPFKSLLALYIAAEAPKRGVVIKLAGKVQLDEKTGQLTTTFDENPQLPFEEMKLHFFGGQQAALATPRTCGTYTTTSLLEPWSHQPAPGEKEGTPNATPESSFEITSGPGGSACAPSAFNPALTAGTDSNQAGGYGTFAMTLTRKDGEQRLSTVSMTMPKGLSGMVSKVPLCDEADANAGTCPAASKIGHVITEAGVGSEPITLPEEGKPEDPVYLTGKYDGAPYGLSIVVPAEAGPFNLGKVIVRAKIEVDPHTAQVSVISDPMPTILQGIPLDIKTIHVEVDRPEFMFNPTSCEPMSVSGTIGSAEGASANVSSRFQAAGCRGLKFKPSFQALVHAKHSRLDGAYLHVVVKSHSGEANIKRVHVALPEELPSRNETLKKACTEEQFDKDPAGCPEGSVVGHAIAYTPMLPKPLRGKAIFVSHADRGFPDLEIVLHGDGITEILAGNTFINKKGVTFSTFASVPDVPISRFDLVLPEGPHSALGATKNLCKHPPVMPTTITGQNGAVVHQKTKAMVTGCKPTLEVVKHKVEHGKAILVVSSPSAGELVAKGSGISPVRERLRKPGATRLVLQLNRHDRQLLAKHPHRRLRVVVHLSLKRHHKRNLSAKVALLMR